MKNTKFQNINLKKPTIPQLLVPITCLLGAFGILQYVIRTGPNLGLAAVFLIPYLFLGMALSAIAVAFAITLSVYPFWKLSHVPPSQRSGPRIRGTVSVITGILSLALFLYYLCPFTSGCWGLL